MLTRTFHYKVLSHNSNRVSKVVVTRAGHTRVVARRASTVLLRQSKIMAF